MSKLTRDFDIAEDHAFTNSRARKAVQDIKDTFLEFIKAADELNTVVLKEVEVSDAQAPAKLKFQRLLDLLGT